MENQNPGIDPEENKTLVQTVIFTLKEFLLNELGLRNEKDFILKSQRYLGNPTDNSYNEGILFDFPTISKQDYNLLLWFLCQNSWNYSVKFYSLGENNKHVLIEFLVRHQEIQNQKTQTLV